MPVLPLYSTSAAVPSLDRILTVAPRRHASATVSSLHRSTGLLLNQPQCSFLGIAYLLPMFFLQFL
jgi:hypothetical protein